MSDEMVVYIEEVRKVLKLAYKNGIDTPGFGMAALKRIERGIVEMEAEITRVSEERDRFWRACGSTL